MPDRARARFIFILSPERSGSTLLSAVLGGHSRIVAPSELHLLRYATLDEWRREYPPAEPSLASLLETLGLQPSEAGDERTPVELYEQILESAQPGSFIVDKTPAYAREPEALRRADSLDALYVWLVRHPLAVAASRLAWTRGFRRDYNRQLGSLLRYPGFLLREWVRRWSGGDVRALCEDWALAHERIREFLSGRAPEGWVRVHYEDLVRAPREQAEELCAFLGLQFEPPMLDPRANAPAGLRWGIGDEKLLEREDIDASVADAWRRDYGGRRLPPAVALLAEQLGVRL
jgi:hypothetical protein